MAAPETADQRRARLQAELTALDTEDRETRVAERADQTGLGDVLGHLVAHSAGYPHPDDREVHARAIRREFRLGEYAPEHDEAKAEARGPAQKKASPGGEA